MKQVFVDYFELSHLIHDLDFLRISLISFDLIFDSSLFDLLLTNFVLQSQMLKLEVFCVFSLFTDLLQKYPVLLIRLLQKVDHTLIFNLFHLLIEFFKSD